jgi:putative membrane-bound dehydrogenase-like protein
MLSLNKSLFLLSLLAPLSCPLVTAQPPPPASKGVSLFDGKTLAGWEGDAKLWRVQDGALTGGSLKETVKQNEFLASVRDYTNFIVRFKIKLTGTEGFINSGFQIRSQRVPNNSEMAGYQCDFGEPNWYGAIYDESRRNKVMSAADMKALRSVVKKDDWNEYVIRADGSRVTTWINSVTGTDFIEPDTAIPNYDWGKLGIQVHGGGKASVQVKDITIEELPPTPPGKKFIGAPEPKNAAKASPLSPDEERAEFTLPPGFEIELVAAESEGIGKFVAVDWDQRGNLWTMTALEYPVDANENPAVARELYASKAKDKVVVFDRDPKSPSGYSSKPRIFVDGLAIPLGILPYKNGVYVQHGPDIVFLSDTDVDGRSDRREVILSGFGVQDSHLFPHQFTRAPGNCIWMAQGAFNYGKVRTQRGGEVQFDQTRMAKFRYDGSEFEITSQGPCNIWGLAMTAEGETWIQEANDYGYPTMPFHEYANYPGCSDAQWKSYAPEFPGTAPDFRMGGTGLSGLAITDKPASTLQRFNASTNLSWPEAYCDVHYIANPITRKIQAIKAHRDGPRWKLQKLPDFVQSSDEWFRPVALRLGPDGCLYFVDWYNKIISHNEVPRNHPERDKKRGRIWRVKHRDVKPLDVPDFTKLSGDELIAKLGGDNTTQSHLAWQAITDRQMIELAPKLKAIVIDKSQNAGKRIGALWALEGLENKDRVAKGTAYSEIIKPMLGDPNRNLRREAVRVLAAFPPSTAGTSKLWSEGFDVLDRAGADPEPEVRAEVIKTSAQFLTWLQFSSEPATARLITQRALPLLIRMAGPSLLDPTAKSTHSGKTIKTDDSYDREFERYLVRLSLEQHPGTVAAFLEADAATSLPLENRLVAALALEPKASASRVAQLLPQLTRPPGQEEVLRLAQFPDEPGVGDALKRTLENSATSGAILEALLKVRNRLDTAKLSSLLTDAARKLLSAPDQPSLELGTRLAGAFKLAAVEPELVAMLQRRAGVPPAPAAHNSTRETVVLLSALRALREIGAGPSDLFGTLARNAADASVREEAVAALAASRAGDAPGRLLQLWPELTASQRRVTLASVTSTRPGASAVVKAVKSDTIDKADLDSATFDKLQAVLGEDAELASLLQEMASFFRPALRLNGEDNAWSETDITLDGPFTVETWVKLDPGIDNNDGILGAPGALDMNFHDGRFRVWVGGEVHDAIVAKKKTVADVWTHLTVTRDEKGNFRIHQNGEIDTVESKAASQKFEHCRIAWTAPGKGTAGWMTEFRVWDRARTADEIRADFDRSYADASERGSPSRSHAEAAGSAERSNASGHGVPVHESRAAGLVHYASGAGPWGKLHSGARVQRTSDLPALLTAAEARAQSEKFARFRDLTEKPGDATRGNSLFTTTCTGCHSVSGKGGQIGPVLSGAGALGVEALLRNLLTPNAAIEPGYRVFRVELKDGEIVDGLLVSQDNTAAVLRRQNAGDLRIPQSNIRRATFTRLSMMPEGLLEAFQPQDVTDLFAYLKTLK